MRALRLALSLAVAAAGALSVPAGATAQSAGAGCDPNYDMACVPIAYDVDCAGGQGDGPAYVAGPVRVIGRDIYKLDRDGNGYGCEPKGWTPPR